MPHNALFLGVEATVVILATIAIGRILSVVLKRILKRFPRSLYLVASNSMWLILLWISLLTLLNLFNLRDAFNLTTIAVIAIGIVAQGFIQSILYGFIYVIEHSFVVGDYIQIAGTINNIPMSGTITNISLRLTTLLNDDNIEIFIPNVQLFSSVVIKGKCPVVPPIKD